LFLLHVAMVNALMLSNPKPKHCFQKVISLLLLL
jgi:hypothetical protein